MLLIVESSWGKNSCEQNIELQCQSKARITAHGEGFPAVWETEREHWVIVRTLRHVSTQTTEIEATATQLPTGKVVHCETVFDVIFKSVIYCNQMKSQQVFLMISCQNKSTLQRILPTPPILSILYQYCDQYY
jgi:hypothetical protein